MRNLRALIGRPINFELYAGKIIDPTFPKDENGKTNCVVLTCWALGIDRTKMPDKCIDYMCDNFPKLDKPRVNAIIAYRSTTRLNGYTYVPGCCAIISKVQAGEVLQVIGIHPKYGEIIWENPPDIFKNKPVVYLDGESKQLP